MSDAFEEVEESLRRDKYAEFFKKYAVAIAAVVVLVLAAVGGVQAWRAWRLTHHSNYAVRLQEAYDLVQARKFADAEKRLSEIANAAPGGYKTAALIALGGSRAERGDTKAALEAYDSAASASPTKEYRNAARLRAAYLAADIEPAKLEARLKPLIDDGGAFAFQARELRALQAYDAGQIEKAREDFEFLSLALDAPQSLRGRAQSALSVMGPAPQGAAPADAPAPSSKPGEKK